MMLSRRRFLQISAASTGLAITGTDLLSQAVASASPAIRPDGSRGTVLSLTNSAKNPCAPLVSWTWHLSRNSLGALQANLLRLDSSFRLLLPGKHDCRSGRLSSIPPAFHPFARPARFLPVPCESPRPLSQALSVI